ncbi:hypothetical protein JCM3765_000913 [Sporobolomyces pararoseus]
MTSYITQSDLESLNLSTTSNDSEPLKLEELDLAFPTNSSETTTSSHETTTTTSTSTSSTSTTKQVSFCPLAVLIKVAEEGEIETTMFQSFKKDLGKKQLSVKTYSLETPNFGNVSSRAWNSVRNGLTATLEPLLNNNTVGGGGGGITSSSRRRESSPERERYKQFEYKCPVSSSNRSSSKPGQGRRKNSFSSWSTEGEEEEEEEEEFITSTNGATSKLKLKIPTVKRRCSRTSNLLLSKTSKSCLRSPTTCSTSYSYSSSNLQPFSTTPPSSSSNSSSHLLNSPTRKLSQNGRSPFLTNSKPILPTCDPSSAILIPVIDCCKVCNKATEYGYGSNTDRGDEYVEIWSKGAKKLKAEQEKERKEREEWLKNSSSPSEEEQKKSEEEKKIKKQEQGEEEWQVIDEDDNEESNSSGSKLGLKAKGVDELQLGKNQRHVKKIKEKKKEKEQGMIEIPLNSSTKTKEPESTSPRSIDTIISTTNESERETPLTSPELVASPSIQDGKLTFPSTSSEPPTTTTTKRPPIKQRSSSISNKIVSFSSSFFGGVNNSSVQGVRF